MTAEDLTRVGVGGLLAVIVIAFYSGRVQVKASADEYWGKIVALWQERHADVVLDRDGWKAQAQQLATAVEKTASELEEANRRDEEWRAAFESGKFPDRRRT